MRDVHPRLALSSVDHYSVSENNPKICLPDCTSLRSCCLLRLILALRRTST